MSRNLSRWLVFTLAAIILLPIAVAGFNFVRPDVPWNAEPESKNGSLVFKEHISAHPGFYSAGNMLNIFTKVDVLTLMTKNAKGVYREEQETFIQASPIGIPMPDFDLRTADGRTLNTADLRGKVAAFMFVAMTCPPARLQVPLWTALQKKYSTDEVELFVVYSRERHPGEPGYREFKQTTTDDEKMHYAQMLGELTDLKVAVDSIEMETLKQYGMVPNAAFVVDRDGLLVFKSQWSDSNKVEYVIDSLLKNYRTLEET